MACWLWDLPHAPQGASRGGVGSCIPMPGLAVLRTTTRPGDLWTAAFTPTWMVVSLASSLTRLVMLAVPGSVEGCLAGFATNPVCGNATHIAQRDWSLC